jgi:hypothetical protein
MNRLLLCGGMVFVAAGGQTAAAADASGDGYSGACSMQTCVYHVRFSSVSSVAELEREVIV